MITSPHATGTTGWLEERAGVLSASELGELVKLNFDLRTGEMVQTLLARKLAEKWSGPIASEAGAFAGSWAMIQGQILEEQAIPWLEFTQGITISRPGFLMNDSRSFGCTPDGIFDETGVEIKCFQHVNAVKTLLDGEVPREHLAQIHGGMYVTGFKRWMFLSYHRSFPKLLLTVDRDEEIQQKIAKAVAYFTDIFNDAWAQLVELNGGVEPPPREPMTFSTDHIEMEDKGHSPVPEDLGQFNAH